MQPTAGVGPVTDGISVVKLKFHQRAWIQSCHFTC